jgi:hypothetical protein
MLFVGASAFGQKVSGVVLDKTTRQPIISALVKAGNSAIRTNNIGQFEIDVPDPGDSIKVTALGYKTSIFSPGKPGVFLTIQLEPKVTKLNEVVIHGTRDFKPDSLENRAAFAKQFNYKPPTVMDAFSTTNNGLPGIFLSVNPVTLIRALNKKNLPEYKFKQLLIKDEHDQYIDEHFNRGIVSRITVLKGDTLYEFLTRYRPTLAFTKKATDYDMEVYIKDCYKKFKKEGFPISR